MPFPRVSCGFVFLSPDERSFPLQHPRGHQTLLRRPRLQEHLGFRTRKGLVLEGGRHWGALVAKVFKEWFLLGLAEAGASVFPGF